MDLSIRPDIGMTPIGMLHVPVKILFTATWAIMWNPLVVVGILVASLVTTKRVLQPIAALRRHKRMAPAARQQPPRVFYRPIASRAHAAAPCRLLTGQTRIVPGGGSRATKS